MNIFPFWFIIFFLNPIKSPCWLLEYSFECPPRIKFVQTCFNVDFVLPSSLNSWKLKAVRSLLQWHAHVVIRIAHVEVWNAHFVPYDATFVFLSSKICNSQKLTNTVKNGDRCSKLKHKNIQNDATFLVSSYPLFYRSCGLWLRFRSHFTPKT